MRYIYDRSFTLIAFAFALGAMLLFAALLYLISDARSTYLREVSGTAALHASRETREQLGKLLLATKAERAELNTYLIQEADIVDFLARIESLGRSQGATISTDSLSVVPKSAIADDLTLTITARGTFASVMAVLELLETLPYKSQVRGASIGQSGVSGTWEGTFDIVVAKHTTS